MRTSEEIINKILQYKEAKDKEQDPRSEMWYDGKIRELLWVLELDYK